MLVQILTIRLGVPTWLGGAEGPAPDLNIKSMKVNFKPNKVKLSHKLWKYTSLRTVIYYYFTPTSTDNEISPWNVQDCICEDLKVKTTRHFKIKLKLCLIFLFLTQILGKCLDDDQSDPK